MPTVDTGSSRMGIVAFAFYLFAALAILSGFGVVFARNPVHAVLWLIVAFLASAGLFVLQGAEYVAMLLVIVYVGAVAVLFLFVVMMLDIDFATFRAGMARSIPAGVLIGAILLMILALELGDWQASEVAASQLLAATPDRSVIDNIEALGRLIYTEYVLLFQTAGLILLVAMIGAIVLTHRRRQGVKRQDILAQLYRDPATAIELRDIRPKGEDSG